MKDPLIAEEIRRIIAMNLKELGDCYSLTRQPEKPRIITFEGKSAFFGSPATFLIGLENQELISGIAHETGHYLKYWQNPRPWNSKTREQQRAEEVLAELHAITFLDSRDMLRYVLKNQDCYEGEFKKVQQKAIDLYREDQKALKKLANLKSEELVKITC